MIDLFIESMNTDKQLSSIYQVATLKKHQKKSCSDKCQPLWPGCACAVRFTHILESLTEPL